MTSLRRALFALTLALITAVPAVCDDGAGPGERASLLIDGKPANVSAMALRLALEEGGAYLACAEPSKAKELAVKMALRAETSLRFGSSPAAIRLELRRTYGALSDTGSERDSVRMARIRNKHNYAKGKDTGTNGFNDPGWLGLKKLTGGGN